MTLIAARLLVAILFACTQRFAASIPVAAAAAAADAVAAVPTAAAALAAAEAEGRRRMPHDKRLRRQDEDRDALAMRLLARPEPRVTGNLHGTVIVWLRNVNKPIACVHNSGLIVNIRAEADMCRNRFFIVPLADNQAVLSSTEGYCRVANARLLCEPRTTLANALKLNTPATSAEFGGRIGFDGLESVYGATHRPTEGEMLPIYVQTAANIQPFSDLLLMWKPAKA